MALTFAGSEPCDHVMIDLLLSALRTLQQANLLAGVFPSKVSSIMFVGQSLTKIIHYVVY